MNSSKGRFYKESVTLPDWFKDIEKSDYKFFENLYIQTLYFNELSSDNLLQAYNKVNGFHIYKISGYDCNINLSNIISKINIVDTTASIGIYMIIDKNNKGALEFKIPEALLRNEKIKKDLKSNKNSIKLLKSKDIIGFDKIIEDYRHLSIDIRNMLHKLQKLDYFGTCMMKVDIKSIDSDSISVVCTNFIKRIDMRCVDSCTESIKSLKSCFVNPTRNIITFVLNKKKTQDKRKKIDDGDIGNEDGFSLIKIKKPKKEFKNEFSKVERIVAIKNNEKDNIFEF